MRNFIRNFRGGLSFWLLGLAFSVAPEEEKYSLATALSEHCDRVAADLNVKL